jgi:hypothetical protein
MPIIRLTKNSPKTFSQCRLCKAKIFWAATHSSKNIPVDYDEDIEYLFDGIAKPYFDAKTMVSHFSSCRYADVFRKG